MNDLDWLAPLVGARQERQLRLAEHVADHAQILLTEGGRRQLEELLSDFVLAEIRLGLDAVKYPVSILRRADPRLPDFHYPTSLSVQRFYGHPPNEPLPTGWAKEIEYAMECGNVAFVVGYLQGHQLWLRPPLWKRLVMPFTGGHQKLYEHYAQLHAEVHALRELVAAQAGFLLPVLPLEPWASAVDSRVSLFFSGLMIVLSLPDHLTIDQLRVAELQMLRRCFVIGYCHAKGTWPSGSPKGDELVQLNSVLQQLSEAGVRERALIVRDSNDQLDMPSETKALLAELADDSFDSGLDANDVSERMEELTTFLRSHTWDTIDLIFGLFGLDA